MRNQYQLHILCSMICLGFLQGTASPSENPSSRQGTTTAAVEKPNFVVIFCDDMGYGDIGCFGSDKNRTPCLDQMAREGARFTSFYVTSGVCSPSRSSLMTGCYPLRVGMDQSDRGCYVLVPGDRRGLNPEEVTIPEVLKTRGYVSACIGKWHLGDQPQFLPRQQGFDYYYGLPYSNDMNFGRGNRDTPPLPLMQNERILEAPVDQDTVTQRYTQEAVRFIREHKDQPFFLYLPHMMVHVPLHVGQAYRGRSPHGLYADAVEEIDGSTQQIMATLRELNLDDKTLVVFTSDNGAIRLGSNRPFSGGKATTREGGMRMPCVMRWPGKIPAGMVCDEVTSTMDLLPTLARLAGAQAPTDRVIDGADIRDLMFNRPGAVSPYKDRGFFYYFMNQLQAVRSGRWKLCVRCDPVIQGFTGKPNGVQAEALYDLQDDPAETTNVADAHPEVVRRLNALADAARRDIGDYQVKGQGQRPYGYVADPITVRRSVSGTTTFGVMTYNVWQWGHLSPQELAPIVKDSGATILGLQEAWEAQHNEDLRDCLGWKTVLYGGRESPQVQPPQGQTAAFWINGYYMPQTLVTPYEVLEHKYFNTVNAQGYPDQGLPLHRGAILAKLRLPSQEVVCVLVLHLMPGQEAEERRVEEIKSILTQVRPYDQYPIVVMGDFNSRSPWDGAPAEAARVTKIMEEFGFQDAYRCVHPNPGKYPGQTNDGLRIDYVFVNRHLIPLDCFPLQAGVFGSEGFADSDHLAVYAKLAIAPASAEIETDKP